MYKIQLLTNETVETLATSNDLQVAKTMLNHIAKAAFEKERSYGTYGDFAFRIWSKELTLNLIP
jgi:hypothetical protein